MIPQIIAQKLIATIKKEGMDYGEAVNMFLFLDRRRLTSLSHLLPGDASLDEAVEAVTEIVQKKGMTLYILPSSGSVCLN